MISHYIYEIVGKKIGCTKNIEKRIRDYPLGSLYNIRQVLEDLTDEEAGETELVWQCSLGYPKDRLPYEETLKRRRTAAINGGKVQGQKNIENGHMDRIKTSKSCSKGGKIGGKVQGKKNIENGHMGKIGKISYQKRVADGSWAVLMEKNRTPENQLKAAKAGGKKSLGKHWFNNGIISTMAFTCPEGFIPGRIKWAMV